MNNLLVCSHSLRGKIEWIKVKMNDVTMHGTSAYLYMLYSSSIGRLHREQRDAAIN